MASFNELMEKQLQDNLHTFVKLMYTDLRAQHPDFDQDQLLQMLGNVSKPALLSRLNQAISELEDILNYTPGESESFQLEKVTA